MGQFTNSTQFTDKHSNIAWYENLNWNLTDNDRKKKKKGDILKTERNKKRTQMKCNIVLCHWTESQNMFGDFGDNGAEGLVSEWPEMQLSVKVETYPKFVGQRYETSG